MRSPEEIQQLFEEAFGGRDLVTSSRSEPTYIEDSRPARSPAEIQQLCEEAFGGRNLVTLPERRVQSPQPKLSPAEVQQRLNDFFGDMPPRPEPIPPPRRGDLSPEDLQHHFNEAFAGVLVNDWTRPEPPREPPSKLTPDEVQRQLNEAFAPYEWAKSHPGPGPSPRSLRFLQRAMTMGKRATGGPSRRQRCNARVKNLIRIGKHGVRVSRGPFCKAWAMENGRCWMHGGASTGPRTPEGKARVVAAMVEGRRRWAARRRVEGRKFPAGRKGGERWVTEPMRERARAEARRLNGGRFDLHDRALTLALLRSANGCPENRAKAKAMLDAQERAALERDRQAALAHIDELRASLLADS
jgi:hypothetical protein